MMEMDVKVPLGQDISVIIKKNIHEVFLQSPGAFAVGGGWAKARLIKTETGYATKKETYSLSLTDFDGLAMVGVSTGNGKESLDKVAFVLAVSPNASHKTVSYSSQGFEVGLTGNFTYTAYRGKVNWQPSFLENSYLVITERSGEQALIRSQLREPFYWAAAYLNCSEGIRDYGVNPVYARKRGANIGKFAPTPIIDLTAMPASTLANDIPAYGDSASDNGSSNGFRLDTVVSGIEIFKFKDDDGEFAIGFADVLIGKDDNSDEMIKYMLEQANQMEAVAQSIRIVAEAKLVAQKGLM